MKSKCQRILKEILLDDLVRIVMDVCCCVVGCAQTLWKHAVRAPDVQGLLRKVEDMELRLEELENLIGLQRMDSEKRQQQKVCKCVNVCLRINEVASDSSRKCELRDGTMDCRIGTYTSDTM